MPWGVRGLTRPPRHGVAAFWASEPGVGDPDKNGWPFFDELYDQTPHKSTERSIDPKR